MEGQNYLGIYIGRDSATVVCLSAEGRDHRVLGCFSVTAGDTEDSVTAELVRLIVEQCGEKVPGFQNCEVAVALDCAMFMQHDVHSEFKDLKQIASTIRFDTEEALSTDISDVALAFRVNSSEQNGSKVTVFTAKQNVLSEIVLCLQSRGVDPVSIEPDVQCLSRFVQQKVSVPDDTGCLYSLLALRCGYFIAFTDSNEGPAVRTFLIAPGQDRADLLTREIPVTSALIGGGESIGRVRLFDSSATVDGTQLGERLGLKTENIDLAGSAGTDPDVLADCVSGVDFAIAYGTALAHVEKTQRVDFRSDFMPYQGKKMRLQKTLRFLSIAFCILVFAVGLHFQIRLFGASSDRKKLRNKLKPDYLAVMPDKKKLPRNPLKMLNKERRRIENLRKGLLGPGEMTIPAKLTKVLAAFNKVAKETNLNIDTIIVSDRNVSIMGDTQSRNNQHTLRLFKAVEAEGLEISKRDMSSASGRDSFRITIETRK